MLSDRRQRVLKALIKEYVANAHPVGSRTLTERYVLGVSPATVRNELSALEEGGYISQPHTSAGRIPTDFGYRTFVDDLLSTELVTQSNEYEEQMANLKTNAMQLDSLLEQTTAALARFTECLSIVLAPTIHNLSIHQITLVCMDQFRVLLVLVTEDGKVLNRHIEFSYPVSPEDISITQSYLNENLVGKSLSELQSGLLQALGTAQNNPYVRQVLSEIMKCIQVSGEDHSAHKLGLSALLAQPEFSQSSSLAPIMHLLEDENILFQLFDSQFGKDMYQTSVSIGNENPDLHLPGVSVVASKYGRGNSVGVVAIIGPTRMDYSKVIQAVRAASTVLHKD